MNIGRRIYYEKATGNIILDTGERSGDVVETTIAQDLTSYTLLVARAPESVGCTQLEYGQDADKFTAGYNYRVELTTGKIVFSSQNATQALERKLSELDISCNSTILAGFTSDCLGESHEYDFDEEAQRNLTGRLGLVNSFPTLEKYQAFSWKTKDAGPLVHTQAEFRQLCSDADDHKDGLIARYWVLKEQAEAAAAAGDDEALAAIVW